MGSCLQAEEDPKLVWPFVESMSALSDSGTPDADACWRTILSEAVKALTPSMAKVRRRQACRPCAERGPSHRHYVTTNGRDALG
jgi:hypothetical protein